MKKHMPVNVNSIDIHGFEGLYKRFMTVKCEGLHLQESLMTVKVYEKGSCLCRFT